MLHALCAPFDDMICIVGVELAHMFKPWRGLCWVSGLDFWWLVCVEAPRSALIDPATFADQPIFDELRHAWRPRHHFDGVVFVDPCGWLDELWLTFFAQYRLLFGVYLDNWLE